MRIIDAPDEVHLRVVAKNKLAEAKENCGRTNAYDTFPQLNDGTVLNRKRIS